VHLRGYGFIKVFRTVDPRGNADYWATHRLQMTVLTVKFMLTALGSLRTIIAPSSSLRAFKQVNSVWKFLNIITSGWLSALLLASNFTVGSIVYRFLMPNSTLFAKRYASILPFLRLFFLQLRNA
jgi:hypothetical protein